MPFNQLRHLLIRENDARQLAAAAPGLVVRDMHLTAADDYAALAVIVRRSIASLPRVYD